MNIVLRALYIVTMTVSLIAQVPFTARQGLSAAQGLGGQQMPSAIGTPVPLQSGNALFWIYAFTAQDSLTTVQVVQPQANNFTATIFPIGDTTGLPIVVYTSPLPADIIDSDSAMRIFTANPTYIDWHMQHRVRSEILLAGRLSSNDYPLPELTPVWIYRAVDTTGTYAMTCFCTHDGSSHGCSSAYVGGGGGGYPFPVYDGLDYAKEVAGSTSNPCLVGTFDEPLSDTVGKSGRWIYVFCDDSALVVKLQGIKQNLFQADTAPPEDTTDIGDFPFYICSNPFAEGWLNSTEAMERFRQHPVYRQFSSNHPIERVQLWGGRINPLASSRVNLPVGTALWLMIYNNSNDSLLCWCNLEPTESPFVDCYATVASISLPERTYITLVPNPASDVVTLHAQEGLNIGDVTVCDLFGRTLKPPLHPIGSAVQLDIHHLSSGTYFVEVKGTNWIERRLLQVVR